MARALRVRLIEIKKQINAAKSQIEEELAGDKENTPNVNAKLEVENLRLKAQLNRAHLYGRLFSGDVIFRCIPCFVVHDVILNMHRTKALVAGVKRYKCQRCGDELGSDEQP